MKDADGKQSDKLYYYYLYKKMRQKGAKQRIFSRLRSNRHHHVPKEKCKQQHKFFCVQNFTGSVPVVRNTSLADSFE